MPFFLLSLPMAYTSIEDKTQKEATVQECSKNKFFGGSSTQERPVKGFNILRKSTKLIDTNQKVQDIAFGTQYSLRILSQTIIHLNAWYLYYEVEKNPTVKCEKLCCKQHCFFKCRMKTRRKDTPN